MLTKNLSVTDDKLCWGQMCLQNELEYILIIFLPNWSNPSLTFVCLGLIEPVLWLWFLPIWWRYVPKSCLKPIPIYDVQCISNMSYSSRCLVPFPISCATHHAAQRESRTFIDLLMVQFKQQMENHSAVLLLAPIPRTNHVSVSTTNHLSLLIK